ncbi:riboflavin kinase [Thermococcus profundus]|uniref:Riboflavin kinase n=1 Tax=Thermococcus profundus TaxID=49899 RepID=A0A2Z2MES4_THEPR|nr:DUF120 domain-containing protein [Thermococcus profundus]ASJ03232.1 riboflavin kinase [Thermococcus profundus]
MKLEKTQVLIELALLGAVGEKRGVTLRELAKRFEVSPQTVMRLLEELEEEGLITREVSGRKTYVEISDEGLGFLEGLCEKLEKALYRGIILGEVVSGLGEGSYYVKLYSERIREYLGFEPYPGTLNVRVVFPKTVFDALVNVRPILIPGFIKEGRTFGDVRAYPVEIDGIKGAIVVPSRTVHPPRIAEIIAPVNLRKALGLGDGDRVKIRAVKEAGK